MTQKQESMKKALMEAVKAVEDAGVPDDLRVAAFERMFEAILGEDAGASSSSTPGDQGSVEGLGQIASRLAISEDLASEVFDVNADHLGLVLSPSKFDPRKARGTQQIALLIAAGRQAAGLDDWTPMKVIREACREYGRLDIANFATTVKGMGDVFSFRGRGQSVELRVTRPGFERAGELARTLRGG